MAAVREAMTSVGAQLAHTAGAQYVLAFGHEVGDNPTRAAANAGEMIVARGLAKRALVDLASVSIQARPDGTRRYQSPLFAKKEQYPGEADPERACCCRRRRSRCCPISPAEPVPGRPGTSRLQKATQAAEHTTTRMGVAPLVGRDDLLRTLLESARAAASSSTPTIVTLLGEPGYGKTHLAQMLVQHLEVRARSSRRCSSAPRRCWAASSEQTTRELLRATLSLPEAAPADLGRALLAERLGAEIGQGGLGRRGGDHGVGAARASRAARAGGRAGRLALGRRARRRRGAARAWPASGRWRWSSRTRTSSTRRRSTRSSTRR